MNRTEFIGINLYYSQDFVDDRYKEIEELKQENKQLKEEIKKYINSNDFVYDELYKKRERIEEILGDKE